MNLKYIWKHFRLLFLLCATVAIAGGCCKKTGMRCKRNYTNTHKSTSITQVKSKSVTQDGAQKPIPNKQNSSNAQSTRQITSNDVKNTLAKFHKEIDYACSKCDRAGCVPSFLLSDFQTRQLNLCPAVRNIKKNRDEIDRLLVTPAAIDSINDIVDEFDLLIRSKYSKNELERAFLNFVECQERSGRVDQLQQAAIGFAYCWLFRF